MPEVTLEMPETDTFRQVVSFSPKGSFRTEEMEVVPMFDVAFPVDLQPVSQPWIIQEKTGMQSLQQDGMAVMQKPPDQGLRPPAFHDIRVPRQSAHPSGQARVVTNLLAELCQFRSRFPAVFKTVKDNLHPLPV
jgi:hypothetical protein